MATHNKDRNNDSGGSGQKFRKYLKKCFWEQTEAPKDRAPSGQAESLGCAIEAEREEARAQQAQAAMLVIPKILEAWGDLPNDIKSYPELNRLAGYLADLDEAMGT